MDSEDPASAAAYLEDLLTADTPAAPPPAGGPGPGGGAHTNPGRRRLGAGLITLSLTNLQSFNQLLDACASGNWVLLTHLPPPPPPPSPLPPMPAPSGRPTGSRVRPPPPPSPAAAAVVLPAEVSRAFARLSHAPACLAHFRLVTLFPQTFKLSNRILSSSNPRSCLLPSPSSVPSALCPLPLDFVYSLVFCPLPCALSLSRQVSAASLSLPHVALSLPLAFLSPFSLSHTLSLACVRLSVPCGTRVSVWGSQTVGLSLSGSDQTLSDRGFRTRHSDSRLSSPCGAHVSAWGSSLGSIQTLTHVRVRPKYLLRRSSQYF